MNPPRKKVKHLALTGLLALFLVTGCAHGGNPVATEGSGVSLDASSVAAASDSPGAPMGEGLQKTEPDLSVDVTADEAGKVETVGLPAASEVKDPEDKPVETETEPPSDALVGGDDVDEFFDDTGTLQQEVPVTAVEVLVPDPLIRFNRAMFAVNDRLYFWCLKPMARGYRKVTPEIVRKGVRNFFYNLGTPGRLVSSVLQGKFKGAGSELGRFMVNTTLGVGGVWDPAERYFGLKPSDEDLGQTLGSYHIDNGVYIVWPLLGPSTLRDTVGKVGDIFLNPLYYLNPNELALGLGGLETVNDTTFRIGDYETVKSTYMDPYVMIRDLYIAHRKKKIAE